LDNCKCICSQEYLNIRFDVYIVIQTFVTVSSLAWNQIRTRIPDFNLNSQWTFTDKLIKDKKEKLESMIPGPGSTCHTRLWIHTCDASLCQRGIIWHVLVAQRTTLIKPQRIKNIRWNLPCCFACESLKLVSTFPRAFNFVSSSSLLSRTHTHRALNESNSSQLDLI
jgi:hypothetical protein